MGRLILGEESSAPGTPSADKGVVYPKTDGMLYYKNDQGVEFAFLAAGYPCDFRLTLTSGTPVTTSDVTGATTVYCAPFRGNRIALYNGTNWVLRTSAEFSLALGTLTSGKPYDVFCYDNAGVPTLEFLVWTNDTTRATALTTQDGVYVKSGATTRRYLGTFYTTATTTTEDSFAKRFLWNFYNRVPRAMRVIEATASWVYDTATIRQANASASNQLDMVRGVDEDVASVEIDALLSMSVASNYATVAVGLDSTSAFASGQMMTHSMTEGTTTPRKAVRASWIGYPGLGRHFCSWNERGGGLGGVSTWLSAGPSGVWQSGIKGTVQA